MTSPPPPAAENATELPAAELQPPAHITRRSSRRRDTKPPSDDAGSDNERPPSSSSTANTKAATSSTSTKKRRAPTVSDEDGNRTEKKVKTAEPPPEPPKRTRPPPRNNRKPPPPLDDEVSSDHEATTDGDAAVVQSRSTARIGRSRRPASQKAPSRPVQSSPHDGTASATKQERPSRRKERVIKENPKAAKHPSPPLVQRGHEVDFASHLSKCQEMGSFTFQVATGALLKTLEAIGNLELPSENMQICAECRGGGDLLCCDCCSLAFHPDCLEAPERPSSLFVPLIKGGLKSVASEGQLRLKDSEWYCPYCLSATIQRCWKRGVPQFISYLNSGCSIGNGGRNDTSSRDSEGNIYEWMKEVQEYVRGSSVSNENLAAFPPNILLALAGIRRAIQRNAPLYQSMLMKEKEDKMEAKKVAPCSAEQLGRAMDSISQEVDPANTKAEPASKPHIMAKKGTVKHEESVGGQQQQQSSETEGGKTETTRRSARRAAAAAAAAAAAVTVSPQVNSDGPRRPTGTRSQQKDEIVVEPPPFAGAQAKVNVGAGFQVPGVNKHFLEAKEFGLNYLAVDRRSVIAYLPMDYLGRVPMSEMSTATTCRLMFSASELEKRRARAVGGSEEIHIPMTDRDLTKYIRYAIALWPVWIQWPPSQEFALKLLHHCRYDTKAALQLLCGDSFQFRAVCDPPIRPYLNKWRPKDKRGQLPSIPFPPPSNSLALMGVPDIEPE